MSRWGSNDPFYRRLDEKANRDRNERIFRDRPENLHGYQGCENDVLREAAQYAHMPEWGKGNPIACVHQMPSGKPAFIKGKCLRCGLQRMEA